MEFLGVELLGMELLAGAFPVHSSKLGCTSSVGSCARGRRTDRKDVMAVAEPNLGFAGAIET